MCPLRQCDIQKTFSQTSSLMGARRRWQRLLEEGAVQCRPLYCSDYFHPSRTMPHKFFRFLPICNNSECSAVPGLRALQAAKCAYLPIDGRLFQSLLFRARARQKKMLIAVLWRSDVWHAQYVQYSQCTLRSMIVVLD